MSADGATTESEQAKLLKAFFLGVHTLFVEHLKDEVNVAVEAAQEPGADDIMGEVTFDGGVEGHVRIRFPREAARAIISKYTGLPEVPDAIFGDAVGELVNVIVGRAKSSLDGGYVSMSTPRVLDGELPARQPGDERHFVCSTGFGTVWIDFTATDQGQKAAA
ncbi:MAG: chemotaxis protein CheX [Phycisphaerales bacterium]